MRVTETGNWVSEIALPYRPPFSNFQVKWDEGNYDDAWIEYIVIGKVLSIGYIRSDRENVNLVENVGTTIPNVNPTISSSVSSIACGSTSPITFTANWENATSFRWTVPAQSGTISGCTTCSTIMVIPSATSPSVTASVEGYNSTCNVYSPQVSKSVTKTIPSISSISGPDEICYGAPSVEDHSVTHIFGADYRWFSSPLHKIDVAIQGYSNATIEGITSGAFDLVVNVTACGVTIQKSKYVTSTSNAPDVDLYEDPEEACAGDCIEYQMESITGYPVGYQYRYNYGFWEDAYSDGSFELCTSSGDDGWNTLELRGEGICGNYGDITEWQILLDNCFYMMAMSAEDSLTMSSMYAEAEDVILYPNPATTTMNVSVPDESIDSEIAIVNDKNEVITRFKNRRKLFALDAGKLNPGYYYFTVVNKNKKSTKRFLVK